MQLIMRRTISRYLFVTIGCLNIFTPIPFLSGCGSKNISGIETEDVRIIAIVNTEDGEQVHVQASFGDGNFLGPDYTLTGGDSLIACVDSTCKTMHTNEVVNALLPLGVIYSTNLPYRSGMNYTISLTRNGYTDAPDSQVILPDSFEILQPAPGTQYTDGESIQVEWFPSGIGLDVTMKTKLTCILENGSEVTNTGDYQVDLDKAENTQSSIADNLHTTIMLEDSTPVSCDIDITVSHSRQGDLDPAFEGGSISGKFNRTIRVQYIAQ